MKKFGKSAIALLLSALIMASGCIFFAGAEVIEDYTTLGTLSAKYESNGNPGAISSGYDAGGVSYGAYQFASKAGVPLLFAKWCISSGKGKATGDRLVAAYTKDGNKYGTNFNNEWKAIAAENSTAFMILQHGYIKSAYYDVMISRVKKSYPTFDIEKYSIALKNVFWSRSVQHGAYSNITINAFKNLGGFKNQKEDVLIKAIYEESGAVTTTGTNKMTGSGAEELGIAGLYMKYFSNNPSSVQVHVYRRLRISELADALEMYYTGLYEHLSEYNITRLAGASRVDTAIEICKSGWSRTGTVILANGYSFADAMAGVPLSYALDAPILLTANDSSGLEANVKTAIVNTRAKNIIILGGTQAVSQSIENQLKKASYNVERVAGSSRYETSTAIAQKLYQVKGSYGDTVFVASGSNYPDALAVSPVAAMLGDPIIYARPDATVDASAAQYFADSAAKKVVILGGSGAVGSAAEDNIRTLGVTDVQRVYGASRYDTAMTIVNKYKSLFTTSDIAFATGVSFPDALAGGAFAAKKGMPVILIAEKTAPSGLSAYISSKNTENIYVFGGYGALSDFAIGNALN